MAVAAETRMAAEARMTNKSTGSAFEKRVVKKLSSLGYWVHFMSPDARGSQPFDVIAVKNGKALAIDCKTCVSEYFNISRMEENQIYAFEKWLRCGNSEPLVMIEHGGDIYVVEYSKLKAERSIKVNEMERAEKRLWL